MFSRTSLITLATALLFLSAPAIHAQTCDIRKIKTKTERAPKDARVARIQPSCDGKAWPIYVSKSLNALSYNSILSVPKATRVVVLSQDSQTAQVVTWIGNTLHEGSVDIRAIEGDTKCPALNPSRVGATAFLNEARLATSLAKSMTTVYAKNFSQFLMSIEKRLKAIESSYLGSRISQLQLLLEKIEPRMRNEISSNPKNKVETLDRLSKTLFSILDPLETLDADLKSLPVSQKTLIVPLSRQWFESSPEMYAYFDREFLHGGFDIKFASGTSGEGINHQEHVESDEFTRYRETLKKLNDFVQTKASQKIRNSPEAEWLKPLIARNFGNARRMIFIHSDSWTADEKPLWADYIPVDQSLGGMPRSRMFSVLMHEVNVNATSKAYFLPSDSHSPDYDTYSLWECVKSQGLTALKADPENLSKFLAIQPPMSVIYLAEILKWIENPVAK